MSFPGGPVVKNPPANAGDSGRSQGWDDPLQKEMAIHSSIAWEILWTEEPGGLYIVHGVAKESDMTEQLSNNRKSSCWII